MSKRRVLTVDEKVAILRELEHGVKNVNVCKKYDLSSSTVSTLLKNKERLLAAFDKHKKGCKRLKKCSKEDLDEALVKWTKDQHAADFPVSGRLCKVQAEKIAKEFGYSGFVCSNGWLDRFKNRHGITFGKLCTEAKSANMTEIVTWLSEKWPDIRDGYTKDDIYNIDETVIPGERCVSINRMATLVFSNISGTDKMELDFKHIEKPPIDYGQIKKAWMTSDIFQTFISKWDSQLRKEKRKILLLIDNAAAHPEIISLTNIRFEVFPPYSTCVLQPMDLGVIRSLKCNYRKHLVLMLLSRNDEKETPNNADVNVLEAIRVMKDAWEDVTAKCIANCFPKDELEIPQYGQSMKEEEHDFVQTVNVETAEKNNATDDDSDADEDSHTEPPPTSSIAFECGEILQAFFETRSASDEVFQAMSLVRKTIAQEREKMKESKAN